MKMCGNDTHLAYCRLDELCLISPSHDRVGCYQLGRRILFEKKEKVLLIEKENLVHREPGINTCQLRPEIRSS